MEVVGLDREVEREVGSFAGQRDGLRAQTGGVGHLGPVVGAAALHQREGAGDEGDDQRECDAGEEAPEASVRAGLGFDLMCLVGAFALGELDAGVEKGALGCVEGFGFGVGPFACCFEASAPVEVGWLVAAGGPEAGGVAEAAVQAQSFVVFFKPGA
jgi:hypothetical protein